MNRERARRPSPTAGAGGHGSGRPRVPPRGWGRRQPRGRDGRQAWVLLIDDDAALRTLLVLALGQAGYPAVAVPDGQAALELLAQQGGDQPDVILLDLHMPVLDGWGFAAGYRMLPTPQGQRAPIVVVSANADAEEAAARLGAVDVLVKPFDLEELLARVARYTDRATHSRAA